MRKTRPTILLFGMPRSGTTWLGKIFDSHPSVLYRHEPDSWYKLDELGLYEDISAAGRNKKYLNAYLENLEEIGRPQVTTKLPLFAKQYSSPMRALAHKVSVYFSLLQSRVTNKIELPVFSPVTQSRSSTLQIAWKSIESLGRMGLILRCAEDCRGVHIIRHPCGYIASVLKGEEGKHFVSDTPCSDDFGMLNELLRTQNAVQYQLNENSLRAMSPVQRLAWRWLLTNEKALVDTEAVESCMTLRYEELCNQPVEVSRQLFEFCGLNWSNQTQMFVGASIKSEHQSYYSVFKNPNLAANKWRSYLSDEQIRETREVVANSARLTKLYADSF